MAGDQVAKELADILEKGAISSVKKMPEIAGFIFKLAKDMTKEHEIKNHMNDYISKKNDGKLSVQDVMSKKEAESSFYLVDEKINGFTDVANKYGIDYSIMADKSEENKYFVYFKAKDIDTMTKAFTEYSEKTLSKNTIREEISKVQNIQKVADKGVNLHKKADLAR